MALKLLTITFSNADIPKLKLNAAVGDVGSVDMVYEIVPD